MDCQPPVIKNKKTITPSQTYILYEILTQKNEMDIFTFVKHTTEEEFHMISDVNKDNGATGAFEN